MQSSASNFLLRTCGCDIGVVVEYFFHLGMSKLLYPLLQLVNCGQVQYGLISERSHDDISPAPPP